MTARCSRAATAAALTWKRPAVTRPAPRLARTRPVAGVRFTDPFPVGIGGTCVDGGRSRARGPVCVDHAVAWAGASRVPRAVQQLDARQAGDVQALEYAGPRCPDRDRETEHPRSDHQPEAEADDGPFSSGVGLQERDAGGDGDRRAAGHGIPRYGGSSSEREPRGSGEEHAEREVGPVEPLLGPGVRTVRQGCWGSWLISCNRDRRHGGYLKRRRKTLQGPCVVGGFPLHLAQRGGSRSRVPSSEARSAPRAGQ